VSETLAHAQHIRTIRKMAGVKVPRKRSKIPRQVYPKMIEKEYADSISEMTGRAAKRAMQPLLDALPGLLASASQTRSDAGMLKNFAGFLVGIENPAGSIRFWRDGRGGSGATYMNWDYGYIDGYVGADRDEVDVYLGPDQDAPDVFAVQQMKAPDFTEYDEDKIMLGFPSLESATAAYLSQYDDPRFLGTITAIPVGQFRDALEKCGGGSVVERIDADEGRKAKELLDKAKKKLGDEGDAKKVEALGRKFAGQTSDHQKGQIQKQTKAALGVNVVFRDKGLNDKIQNFAAENATLITSMQDDVHNSISKIVMRAITNGELHGDVAKKIQDRFDVSESHARLIARDQIGKLYGQINASRQKELGVTHFVWRTVGDERVRDEHDQREDDSDPDKGGEPFAFDDPPDGELPGVPIQCRCTAEPVFGYTPEEADDEEEIAAESADEGDDSGGTSSDDGSDDSDEEDDDE
jgi:SPP1 gp7 family putative phage head morphogenesis protein